MSIHESRLSRRASEPVSYQAGPEWVDTGLDLGDWRDAAADNDCAVELVPDAERPTVYDLPNDATLYRWQDSEIEGLTHYVAVVER